VTDAIAAGADRAREIADRTMEEVRGAMGIGARAVTEYAKNVERR
jgi:hypothetical protein